MVQQKLVDGSPVLQAIHASYLFEKPHQLDRPVPVKDYLTKCKCYLLPGFTIIDRGVN